MVYLYLNTDREMPTKEEYELEYMRLMTLTNKELNAICKEQGQRMYHHQKKDRKVLQIIVCQVNVEMKPTEYSIINECAFIKCLD